MKVALSLTIQEVENRNMPTFLSETALSVARCTCTSTTCTCSCCCNNGDSSVELQLSEV